MSLSDRSCVTEEGRFGYPCSDHLHTMTGIVQESGVLGTSEMSLCEMSF